VEKTIHAVEKQFFPRIKFYRPYAGNYFTEQTHLNFHNIQGLNIYWMEKIPFLQFSQLPNFGILP
jgi:hypothetical protein